MSRRSSQNKQEQISRKQFEEYLEQYDWITTDIVPDLGEDILVRIYDNGNSTGLSLYVQLKSVQNIDIHRLKSGVISYSFDVVDLIHWENQNPPVLLVIWDVNEKRGWWVWADDAVKHLDETNSGWRQKKKVHVHIAAENTLEENGRKRIRHFLADRYIHIFAKDKTLNIHTEFQFPTTPEGQAKLAEFKRHLAAGDEVELDSRYINRFELPKLWEKLYGVIEPKDMYVKLGPTKSDEIYPVQIDFMSPEFGSERVPYVELQSVKQGEEEITLSNQQQTISTKFLLRFNKTTKQIYFAFMYQSYCVDAITLLHMIRIHNILNAGGTIRVTMLKTGDADSISFAPGAITPPPIELIKYVENLSMIQGASGRMMKIPDEDAFSLENVKAAEELVSVFNSGKHRQTGLVFTIELFRPAIELISEAHKKGEPIHFLLKTEESYVDLLGERFDLGPITQHITGKWEMPVDEVIAWLETAGEEEALHVRLVGVELHEEFENWMKEKRLPE